MQNHIDELRRTKSGREIAKCRYSNLIMRAENIVNELDLGEHVAIITYGSAGGCWLVGNSDTDFSMLDDGTLSKEALIKIQNRICQEFSKDLAFGCKSWNRVKVNPMDLLSTRFVCGNRKLFEEQVLNDPVIADLGNEGTIISLLAGNDLHLEFMASEQFSRLMCCKYHTSKELPVGISYGDTKFFTGGVRWTQFIFMIAMLYSGNRFLSDTDINILADKGILSLDDIYKFYTALDFLLTVKDCCCEGSNIFFEHNINGIIQALQMTKEEIVSSYDEHTKLIELLCRKVHSKLVRDFPKNQGVLARITTDINELSAIVDSDDLLLWRTIALRSDMPASIRQNLKNKISDRQKIYPHTMLDEMEVMLVFSSSEIIKESELNAQKLEAKKNSWMTDKVMYYFDDTLRYCVNHPVLIRFAVHRSFLELFWTGNFSDIQDFYHDYIDRVIKYFHCLTLNPDDCVAVAKSACEQILNSGLFHPEHLTLMKKQINNVKIGD